MLTCLDRCALCSRNIVDVSKSIRCVICHMVYHMGCCGLTENLESSSIWYCSCCTVNMFAFNHIADDDSFIECIKDYFVPLVGAGALLILN